MSAIPAKQSFISALRNGEPFVLGGLGKRGAAAMVGNQEFPVLDPASEEAIGGVVDQTVDDAAAAIERASTCFRAWRKTLPSQRAEFLRRWHAEIIAHIDDLGRLLSLEQGKPVAEAIGEIRFAASFVLWYAEEARRAYGDIIPTYAEGRRLFVMREPVGVVAAITPWNFPAAMITRKIAPAIAAGCAVVVKPAPETPFTAMALVELAAKAGAPEGLINLVTSTDAGPVGEVLCEHPKVAKITFTGSTRVGKILMAQAAKGLKRVSLELGGNAPFIVFDDADLKRAVTDCIATKFRNAGQTCVCTNRIYVQKTVADAFTEDFLAAVKELKTGDGFQPDTTVGPLIRREATVRVDDLVDNAREQGGEVLYRAAVDEEKGYFSEPTVLFGATEEMRLFKEEIFGPVAAISTFDSEEEVLQRANSSAHGLASYVNTRDSGRVWRMAEQLEFGLVSSNSGVFSTEVAPFGGVKESGFGREGGREGMEEYLEHKFHCLGEV